MTTFCLPLEALQAENGTAQFNGIGATPRLRQPISSSTQFNGTATQHAPLDLPSAKQITKQGLANLTTPSAVTKEGRISFVTGKLPSLSRLFYVMSDSRTRVVAPTEFAVLWKAATAAIRDITILFAKLQAAPLGKAAAGRKVVEKLIASLERRGDDDAIAVWVIVNLPTINALMGKLGQRYINNIFTLAV